MLKRRYAATLAVLAALPLAVACSDKNDLTTENLAGAMDDYFAKHGEMCLGTEQWPVDVREGVFGVQDGSKMEALREVGMVRADPLEEDFSGGGRTNVTRYSLTVDAPPYTKERVIDSADGEKLHVLDLCWGWMELDKIIGWEGPVTLVDHPQVVVRYTYGITSIAPWAQGSVVQNAFPEVGGVLSGAGLREKEHTVRLTDDGWVAQVVD